MAKASRKHAGPGAHGKGDGSGAMTVMREQVVGENDILSNRDKAQHNQERGLDGHAVQTEQYRDHAANRRDFDGQQEEEP